MSISTSDLEATKNLSKYSDGVLHRVALDLLERVTALEQRTEATDLQKAMMTPLSIARGKWKAQEIPSPEAIMRCTMHDNAERQRDLYKHEALANLTNLTAFLNKTLGCTPEQFMKYDPNTGFVDLDRNKDHLRVIVDLTELMGIAGGDWSWVAYYYTSEAAQAVRAAYKEVQSLQQDIHTMEAQRGARLAAVQSAQRDVDSLGVGLVTQDLVDKLTAAQSALEQTPPVPQILRDRLLIARSELIAKESFLQQYTPGTIPVREQLGA